MSMTRLPFLPTTHSAKSTNGSRVPLAFTCTAKSLQIAFCKSATNFSAYLPKLVADLQKYISVAFSFAFPSLLPTCSSPLLFPFLHSFFFSFVVPCLARFQNSLLARFQDSGWTRFQDSGWTKQCRRHDSKPVTSVKTLWGGNNLWCCGIGSYIAFLFGKQTHFCEARLQKKPSNLRSLFVVATQIVAFHRDRYHSTMATRRCHSTMDTRRCHSIVC